MTRSKKAELRCDVDSLSFPSDSLSSSPVLASFGLFASFPLPFSFNFAWVSLHAAKVGRLSNNVRGNINRDGEVRQS